MNGHKRIILENIFDESQESKSISAAKKYLINRGFSAETSDKYIRTQVRDMFPALRDKMGAKFILGMTRISLDDSEVINGANAVLLNNVLKKIIKGHYNEYDRNLNGLTAGEIMDRFSLSQKEDNEKLRNELSGMEPHNNEYTIIPIKSYEDASKYSKYTDWCITNNKLMYDTYTSDGVNQFYFCLKNGFQNIRKVEGKNAPLDEYGLSMLAVCVDPDGGLFTCTSRWNHNCGSNDSVMSIKEVSNVIGDSFFNVFKPNNKFQSIVDGLQTKLDNGIPPEEVFDAVGEYFNDMANVTIGGKCNWITKDKKILHPQQWFDTTDPFFNGFAVVSLRYKWNFMKTDGTFCSKRWFDSIESVFNQFGLAIVKFGNVEYYLTPKGNILKKCIDVDSIKRFNNHGIAMAIKYNNKKPNFQFLRITGEPLVSDTWFDAADEFYEGFAIVVINNKYNYIDEDGEYLSDNWFDDAWPFENGLGEVSYKDKWWNINTDGELIENRSLNENIKHNIAKARKNVNTNPTDLQKKSGNYKKGHVSINGFKITIENPKGSYRSGTDEKGREWKVKMNNDYGYFVNSIGYDGDHIDVFLGDAVNSKKIFVIDQKNGKNFDESKVMFLFNNEKDAKDAYLSNYEKNWKGFDKITETTIEFFKKWLYDGKKQRKPFYQYKDVKNTIKMTIKETYLRKLIQESIKKVTLNETKESTMLTNKLIKKLYNIAQNYKSKYHDDDWSNVHAMLDEMGQLEGIADFFVADGRYRKHGKEFGEMTKVYKINILTDFNTIINGNVNCHLCGTIDNPWSAYDISVSFYGESNSGEILESITKLLNESINNVYTMDDWNRDGSLKLTVGQCIDDEVYEELLNSVPPTTHKSTLFQPGEAYDMSDDYIELYMTFVNNGQWKYIGLCPKGSTKQLPQIDYSQFNESVKSIKTINESKRGLNSSKLYQIAKEHQGLRPKHGYSYKRFNELTDDDVIGIVDTIELNRYQNASWESRQEWAINKGFKVNKGDDVTFIPMNDWTWVAVIVRGDLLPDKEWSKTPYGEKIINRNKNKSHDGAKNYVWTDSNSDKEKGLVGWSKRANEFGRMKFDNEVRNSKK